MKKNNLSQNVLEKIKFRKIKPTPKWQFLLKDYVIWGAGIISVLVGAFAFAVILYMLVNNHWDIYQYATNSLTSYIFSTLPYYWLLFLSIFLVIAYLNIRHTSKGYKYNLNLIIVASIGVSVILGTIFYGIGLGQTIDNEFSKRMPIYKKFMQRDLGMWHKPGRGIIAGEVIEVIDKNNFILKSKKDINWQVNSGSVSYILIEEIIKGEELIIIGEKVSENKFKAIMIKPWDKVNIMQPDMRPGIMDFHKIPRK